MAKLQLGAIVTDLRGSIGGQTFSVNRAGHFVRTRVVPKNPKTQAQNRVRNMFGNVSRSWNNLTDDERKSYNDAAKTLVFRQKHKNLGLTNTISGFNLYIQISQNRELVGLAPAKMYPGKGQINATLYDRMEYDSADKNLKINSV